MRTVVCAALALASSACSHECGIHQFECQGECLSEDATTAFCGRGAACRPEPCALDPIPPHTSPLCVDRIAGTCGPMCVRLFGDCNHTMDDGCETPLDTDAQNCGGCNLVCHGVCRDGFCTTLVSEAEVAPSGLVVSADGIFWTARSAGQLQLRRGYLDGTPPSVIVSFDAPAGVPAALALAGSDLLVATGSAGPAGAVYLVHPDGGASQLAAGQDAPGGVAAAPGEAFWTNFGGGQVMHAPLDGGASQLVADTQLHPRAITVADGQVFWTNEGTDGGDGAVMARPLDGGASALVSIPAADGRATAAAPVGVGIIRTFPDPLATLATVRVVAWTDRVTGLAWGSKGGVPFALTEPQSSFDPRALYGAVEALWILDRARGLVGFDRLYIDGAAAYAPPFQLLTFIPMKDPVAKSEQDRAWIDGSSVWWGPHLVSP